MHEQTIVPPGDLLDFPLLPMSRERWRAAVALKALLAVGLAGAVVAPLPAGDLGAVAGFLLLGLLVAFGACTHQSHRLLLRLTILPRTDPSKAARAIEDLIARARNPRTRGVLVAALAELELYEGDTRRGRLLFAGLRSRGWTPTALTSGCAKAHADVVDAAATMAALQCVDGPLEEGVSLLNGCAKRPARPSIALLGALVQLRRGRAAAARRLLRNPGDQTYDFRARGEALRILHAFCELSEPPFPYRVSPMPPLSMELRRRLSWLLRPARLGHFAEAVST